jgi:hypothetical protein
MADLSPIETALAPIVATLSVDGYDVVTSGDLARVTIEVVAREDACVDCLVPSDLFAAIVRANLEGAGLAPEISVVYPADSAAPH